MVEHEVVRIAEINQAFGGEETETKTGRGIDGGDCIHHMQESARTPLPVEVGKLPRGIARIPQEIEIKRLRRQSATH